MACCPAVLRTRRADLTEEEDSRQACQMLDKQRLKPAYLFPMRRGKGGQYAGRLGCEPKQRTAPIRWRGFAPDEVDRFEPVDQFGSGMRLHDEALRHIADRRSVGIGGPDREQRLMLLRRQRSEEHTSELQSLMRISYAVFCLKKKK